VAVAPVGPHRVRRPFDADGVRMNPGEIVDVTEWRNAFQLVDRGYLVAIPVEDQAVVEPVKATPAKKPVKKRASTKNPSS